MIANKILFFFFIVSFSGKGWIVENYFFKKSLSKKVQINVDCMK